jgi:hypothetical protein
MMANANLPSGKPRRGRQLHQQRRERSRLRNGNTKGRSDDGRPFAVYFFLLLVISLDAISGKST